MKKSLRTDGRTPDRLHNTFCWNRLNNNEGPENINIKALTALVGRLSLCRL